MMLSKRGFLQLLAAFAALGRAAFARRGEAAMPVAATTEPANLVLAMFSDPASAAMVGQQYLNRFPDEANADRLVQLLERRVRAAPGSADGGSVTHLSESGFAGDLQAAVRLDFQEGRTIDLDGWILARTELRLCALAALERRPAYGNFRQDG